MFEKRPKASRSAADCLAPIIFDDRISAIVGLGVALIAAERCALAFRSGGASADIVVRAPRGDSRWDVALNAVLIALENRLNDSVAARGTRRAPDAIAIDSIDTLTLSARDLAAIQASKKLAKECRSLRRRLPTARMRCESRWWRRRIAPESNWTHRWNLWRAPCSVKSAVGGARRWISGARTEVKAAVRRRRQARAVRARDHQLSRRRRVAGAGASRLNASRVSAKSSRPAGAGFNKWMVAIADGAELTLAASFLHGPL